ncbi:HdeD family acid-resistance protein [Blastochloris viridis]|uniref:HdeD family acid-resistance protein n=2 Tax=Blastochloris viridis TaxID=1079 RepID=A0A0N7IUT8_BLAVI|nr:HdeD family acid-resistance protein [Blastochloris viridis]ALK10278.1 hypothetical protein BVIR_2512 [Blastochloris viridis]CUU42940.1 hypothetical protein BVIRIDIS_19560 [Blastochloris viridis]
MSSSPTTSPLPGEQPAIGRTKSAVLAENWWAVAIRGLAAIIFGVLAFMLPVATILSLLLFFAAYAVVNGVFAIVAAVRAASSSERWGSLLLEGLVSIAGGAIVVLWPGITVDAFVLLVAAWALLTGCLAIAAALRLEIDHGRWWLVLGGVASLLYGVLLILAPFLGAVVMTWWLGAYAFVFGVTQIILALKLRDQRRGAH